LRCIERRKTFHGSSNNRKNRTTGACNQTTHTHTHNGWQFCLNHTKQGKHTYTRRWLISSWTLVIIVVSSMTIESRFLLLFLFN
jgi:hypothetical protein